jgi:hypothetical protein
MDFLAVGRAPAVLPVAARDQDSEGQNLAPLKPVEIGAFGESTITLPLMPCHLMPVIFLAMNVATRPIHFLLTILAKALGIMLLWTGGIAHGGVTYFTRVQSHIVEICRPL